MNLLPSGKGRWLTIVMLVLLSPLLLWLGLIVFLMVVILIVFFMTTHPVLFILLIILLAALYLAARGKLISTYRGAKSRLEEGYTWLERDWRKDNSRTRPLAAIATGVMTFVLVMPIGATLMMYIITLFFSPIIYLLQPFTFLAEDTMDSPFELVLSLQEVLYLHLYTFFLPSMLCGLLFSIYVFRLYLKGKLLAHKHCPLLLRSNHFGLIVVSAALILFGAAFGASRSLVMIFGYGVALIPGGLLASRLGYSLMRTILLKQEWPDNYYPSNKDGDNDVS